MDSCTTKSISPSSRFDGETASSFSTLPWPWLLTRITVKPMSVGGAINTTMKSKQVMLSKSASVGTTYSITAGDELSITVAKARLVTTSDGTIKIDSQKIESMGSDCISFTSPSINNN